jgi:hypothetical protein
MTSSEFGPSVQVQRPAPGAHIPAAGQIVRLFVSSGHNFVGHFGRMPGNHAMVEHLEVSCVAGRGLVGDRYFQDDPESKGQITFFAEEVFELLRSELPDATPCPSACRRNVITRGIDLTALIGVQFELQGVRFAGTEECRPCVWMNRAFGDGAYRFLEGRGGLRARILTDGIMRVGAAAPGAYGTAGGRSHRADSSDGSGCS